MTYDNTRPNIMDLIDKTSKSTCYRVINTKLGKSVYIIHDVDLYKQNYGFKLIKYFVDELHTSLYTLIVQDQVYRWTPAMLDRSEVIIHDPTQKGKIDLKSSIDDLPKALMYIYNLKPDTYLASITYDPKMNLFNIVMPNIEYSLDSTEHYVFDHDSMSKQN